MRVHYICGTGEELYICAVGQDILKFEQTSLLCSDSYLFGKAKPTKDPTRSETVWRNFSLLFNVIDSEKYLGYAI